MKGSIETLYFLIARETCKGVLEEVELHGGVNEIIGKQKNKPEVYSLAGHCLRLQAASAGGRELISHMLCEMLPKDKTTQK